MEREPDSSRLRYLDGSHVKSPLGTLGGMKVTADGQPVGKLDGVLIDPAERRACFVIVSRGPWLMRRQYLVPLDAAQVDVERKALKFEKELRLDGTTEVRSCSFQHFSDVDLVTALFSRTAA